MNNNQRRPCLLCQSAKLSIVAQSSWTSMLVTSDLKLWPGSIDIAVCQHCGHAQKMIDDDYLRQVNEIYLNYQMYPASAGKEPAVFTDQSMRPRSEVVLKWLTDATSFPSTGRMLDLGCGNGGALASFGAVNNCWELYGYELDRKNEKSILSIPGVKGFFTEGMDNIKGLFDLVTMFHLIEHLPEPVEFMNRVRELIAPGGLALIQSPDITLNPFDFIIVDHCSHFSPGSMRYLTARSGFETLHLRNDLAPKEISALVKSEKRGNIALGPEDKQAKSKVVSAIGWLENLAKDAAYHAQTQPFGILGTGIGGTWLAGILSDKVSFFIDEDPSRCGKIHLGKQVISPLQAQEDACVYLPFPPAIAERIRERLSAVCPSVQMICPPGLS
ncbi:hypothetical protein MNBD_NITROSPINAE03-83 [hydrothermal vent metagenome]|uniref:Uncharacterized protein n=1 Tax=hydrothermal vent metagenome TaxID=652676 RepID=A0A3B1D4Y5_9ZZZZ